MIIYNSFKNQKCRNKFNIHIKLHTENYTILLTEAEVQNKRTNVLAVGLENLIFKMLFLLN